MITLAEGFRARLLPNRETKSGTDFVNWKSGGNTKKLLASYIKEHDSFVREIIYCHSRGLALLT